MAEAGFSIMLVGHSLGAGAAALLAMWLKEAGVEKVTCYAFATPNCVSMALAEGCQDYVTSVVFRDDIIARFSPAALAKLHKELQDFDVESAMQEVRHSPWIQEHERQAEPGGQGLGQLQPRFV